MTIILYSLDICTAVQVHLVENSKRTTILETPCKKVKPKICKL